MDGQATFLFYKSLYNSSLALSLMQAVIIIIVYTYFFAFLFSMCCIYIASQFSVFIHPFSHPVCMYPPSIIIPFISHLSPLSFSPIPFIYLIPFTLTSPLSHLTYPLYLHLSFILSHLSHIYLSIYLSIFPIPLPRNIFLPSFLLSSHLFS